MAEGRLGEIGMKRPGTRGVAVVDRRVALVDARLQLLDETDDGLGHTSVSVPNLGRDSGGALTEPVPARTTARALVHDTT